EFEIDVATMKSARSNGNGPSAPILPYQEGGTVVGVAPPRPKMDVKVDFSQLDSCEIRVYRDLGSIELRAAIELVSPGNKDRPESRRTFAAKCAGYLRHGISVI